MTPTTRTPPAAIAAVLAAWDAGARSRHEVAALLGIAPTTAANRMSRCRVEGYLPPLSRSHVPRPIVPQPLLPRVSLDALRGSWRDVAGPVEVTHRRVAIGIYSPIPWRPQAHSRTYGVPPEELARWSRELREEAELQHARTRVHRQHRQQGDD